MKWHFVGRVLSMDLASVPGHPYSDGPPLLVSFQCYLYLFYSPARTMKVVLMLLILPGQRGIMHGLRNPSLANPLHIGVAFLSSHQIIRTRQLQDKQSGSWSVRLRPWDGRILWFSSQGHRHFPLLLGFTSSFHPQSSFQPKQTDPENQDFFHRVWKHEVAGHLVSVLCESYCRISSSHFLDSRIWEPSQKAHYWKTNMEIILGLLRWRMQLNH